MERARQQFRMIIIVLSLMLILAFTAVLASNVVYADPEPTYTITILGYDEINEDVTTTIETLSDKTSFLYTDIQIDEDLDRYEYRYCYYDATAENKLGAVISPQDDPYVLTEDITIVQYSHKIASKVEILSESLGIIDTKFVATISYSDFATYEDVGYEYQYYWYDEFAEDKKGDFIATNTENYSVIFDDCKILQVKHATNYTITIHEDILTGTVIGTANAYYNASLKPYLENFEEDNHYYRYVDKNGDLMSSIDVKVTGDVEVARLPAYLVELFFSEEGSATTTIWCRDIVPKNGYFDIASKFTKEPQYKYIYYISDKTDPNLKGTPLTDINVSMIWVSQEPKYIENESIRLVYSRMLNKAVLSNDQNEYTKEVIYSQKYGTLFSYNYKPGYTFENWIIEGTDIVVTPETIVETEGPHKLIAKFTPNEYTITYVKNNGQENATEVVTFGKTPQGCVPEKTGYEFDCFKIDNTVFKLDEPYSTPSDVTLTASYIAKEYDISFVIEGSEEHFKVTYDTLNAQIITDKFLSYMTNNLIIGMYYLDGPEEVKTEVHILTQNDRRIPKWDIAKDIRAFVVSVPKNELFTTAVPISTMEGFNCIIEIDGVVLEHPNDEEDAEGQSEETQVNKYRSITTIINQIGNHTIRVLDTSDKDNVRELLNHQIIIKEELGIANNTTYQTPIVLNDIVGKVYMGTDLNDLQEVDPKEVRIEDQGTYYIKVVGVNGYESNYVVEYKNIHVTEAWVLFGISGGILLLVLILVIVGRRRVVSYVRDDGDASGI